MDLDKRPKFLPKVQVHRPSLTLKDIMLIFSQALAAIGQCRLISLWDNLFGHLRQPIAQILLTRNDIADVSPTSTT